MNGNRIGALLAVGGMALIVPAARADDHTDVRYLNLGQGSYVIVTPRTERPHALTGPNDTRDDRYWDRQAAGRFVDVGQGRIFIAGGR
jgi:hypothetical protein